MFYLLRTYYLCKPLSKYSDEKLGLLSIKVYFIKK